LLQEGTGPADEDHEEEMGQKQGESAQEGDDFSAVAGCVPQ